MFYIPVFKTTAHPHGPVFTPVAQALIDGCRALVED